jgi:predicted O-methyltransferase YrrM
MLGDQGVRVVDLVATAKRIIPGPAWRALRHLSALHLPAVLPTEAWGTKGFRFWTFLSLLLNGSGCTRILELGSGRSTITLAEYAAFRGARFVSLETSRLWFNKARMELRCLSLPDSPIHLVDWGPERTWYDPDRFRAIVGSETFDLAFIDGPNLDDGTSLGIRDSNLALREILAATKSANVLIVDDVHRRHIRASLDRMLSDPAQYDKFFYNYAETSARPAALCLCIKQSSSARAEVDRIRQLLDLGLYTTLDLSACLED